MGAPLEPAYCSCDEISASECSYGDPCPCDCHPAPVEGALEALERIRNRVRSAWRIADVDEADFQAVAVALASRAAPVGERVVFDVVTIHEPHAGLPSVSDTVTVSMERTPLDPDSVEFLRDAFVDLFDGASVTVRARPHSTEGGAP